MNLANGLFGQIGGRKRFPYGGAGGSWSPLNLSGLGLWLNASNEASLLNATSQVAVNNDPISQWSDLSGNGRHWTQGTSLSRPTLNTTGLNSKRGVSFDGSDDYLIGNAATLSLIKNLAGYTFFLVQSATLVAGGQWFAISTNASATAGRVVVLHSTNYQFYARRLDADASAGSVTGGSISAGVANVLTYRVDQTNTTATVFKDGTQIGNNAAFNTAGSVENLDSLAAQIGRSLAAASPIQGVISELIVYQRALSTGERQLVEGYLRAKWGTP